MAGLGRVGRWGSIHEPASMGILQHEPVMIPCYPGLLLLNLHIILPATSGLSAGGRFRTTSVIVKEVDDDEDSHIEELKHQFARCDVSSNGRLAAASPPVVAQEFDPNHRDCPLGWHSHGSTLDDFLQSLWFPMPNSRQMPNCDQT